MSTYTQLFPPSPAFTEKNVLDLSSKVYIITGATSGVGLALSKILYTLHATVYVGARSSERFNIAASEIQAECPASKGLLKPFVADMADLKTIKPAVELFLKQEYRLDVLFLNAGVMTPPAGSKTKDGFDLELGVNNLAPFLLTTLLLPLLTRTSTHFCHPNTSIRVVWVSSMLNLSTPPGGVQLQPTPTVLAPSQTSFSASSWAPKQLAGMPHYMQSKAGIYLLSHEFSLRNQTPATDEHGITTRNSAGVLHVPLNPGFMKTELQRNAPPPMRGVMGVVFKGPKHGAYTELYAGLGPDVKDGDFVIPWGRKGCVPEHIKESTRAKEGERSVSARFYEWCEQQVRPFM